MNFEASFGGFHIPAKIRYPILFDLEALSFKYTFKIILSNWNVPCNAHHNSPEGWQQFGQTLAATPISFLLYFEAPIQMVTRPSFQDTDFGIFCRYLPLLELQFLRHKISRCVSRWHI